ncbi:MAG TPA: hypothetical protein VM754_06495, partial [Actinomycetota bacterium]|nr:hypothetical protein [Actinomycetota bacterium]
MSRRKAFLRGALAMVAALLVVLGARSLSPRISYPPARVTSLLVNLVPGDFATFMIERLGPFALRGFGIGVNLAVVAAGGVLAIWILKDGTDAQKARRSIVAGAATLGLSLVLAAGDVGGLSLLAVVAYFLAGLVFAMVTLESPLLAAVEPRRVEGDETPLDAMSRSRRNFIVRAAWLVGGLLTGGSVLR